MAGETRYWSSVMYPENMIPNWKDRIDDLLEVPFAYCLHDKDFLAEYNKDDEVERKIHLHLILAYTNTTTRKTVISLLSRLSLPGKSPFRKGNEVERIYSIRQCYEYLIHNTKKAIEQGKFQYPTAERYCGNNFDIGAYEQLSTEEREERCWELADFIVNNGFTSFKAFWIAVKVGYDKSYWSVVKSNVNFLSALIKGNYHEKYGPIYFEKIVESQTGD